MPEQACKIYFTSRHHFTKCLQASAKVLRQRAQGIEASTAFLQGGEEPLDEGAREAAELAAAEKLFQKQLAKEIGVSSSSDFTCSMPILCLKA